MADVKRTEAEMLLLLQQRYTEKAGNGEAWAFITHVRNKAGFDASRTVDALAMGLWPSRGLTIHGFEVKCSRADWLSELRNPAKAETFCRLVDRWWLVTADSSIVKPSELPEGWGWMYSNPPGTRLFVKKEAPPLREGEAPPVDPADRAAWRAAGGRDLPPGVDRSFLASLLRAACRTAEATPQEVTVAVEKALDAERKHSGLLLELTQRELQDAKEREAQFAEITGITLNGFSRMERAEEIAKAVRAALAAEVPVENVKRQLADLRRSATRIVDGIDRTLENIDEPVEYGPLSYG